MTETSPITPICS